MGNAKDDILFIAMGNAKGLYHQPKDSKVEAMVPKTTGP